MFRSSVQSVMTLCCPDDYTQQSQRANMLVVRSTSANECDRYCEMEEFQMHP